MKRVFIPAMSVGALVTGAIIFLFYSEPSVKPFFGRFSQEISVKGEKVDLSSVTYAFKAGETWTVDLGFRSEGSFALQMLQKTSAASPVGGGLYPMNIEINDPRFEVSVIAETEDGYELFLRATEVQVKVSLPGKLGPTSSEPWLTGALLKMSRSGKFLGLYTSADREPLSTSFFRILALSLFPQIKIGEVSADIPGGLLRTKQDLKGDQEDTLAIESEFLGFNPHGHGIKATTQGKGVVRYARMSAFLGAEMLRQTSQTARGETVANEKLQLTVKPKSVRPTEVTLLAQALTLKELPEVNIDVSTESQEAMLALARQKVAGTTFEEVKSRFEAIAPKSLASDHEVYDLLKAWLVIKPEAIPEVAKWLEQFPPEDTRYDITGVLLVTTNRPEGQREVVSRINKHFNDPRRTQNLLFSLALTEKPTTETLLQAQDWLSRGSVENPGYLPSLPLAAAIGYHSDRETRRKIADLVIEHSLSSKDSALKKQAANALGNLGYEGTLGRVNSFLVSSSDEDRSLGVTALRRVQGEGAEEASDRLVAVAASDQSTEVRRLAANNLNNRLLTDANTAVLARRLRDETDPTTVVNLVQAISSGVEDREKALGVLIEYNKECGNPAICRKIESAIQMLLVKP